MTINPQKKIFEIKTGETKVTMELRDLSLKMMGEFLISKDLVQDNRLQYKVSNFEVFSNTSSKSIEIDLAEDNATLADLISNGFFVHEALLHYLGETLINFVDPNDNSLFTTEQLNIINIFERMLFIALGESYLNAFNDVEFSGVTLEDLDKTYEEFGNSILETVDDVKPEQVASVLLKVITMVTNYLLINMRVLFPHTLKVIKENSISLFSQIAYKVAKSNPFFEVPIELTANKVEMLINMFENCLEDATGFQKIRRLKNLLEFYAAITKITLDATKYAVSPHGTPSTLRHDLDNFNRESSKIEELYINATLEPSVKFNQTAIEFLITSSKVIINYSVDELEHMGYSSFNKLCHNEFIFNITAWLMEKLNYLKIIIPEAIDFREAMVYNDSALTNGECPLLLAPKVHFLEKSILERTTLSIQADQTKTDYNARSRLDHYSLFIFM